MITPTEKKVLKWLIPLWIIVITLGVIIWSLYSNNKKESEVEDTQEVEEILVREERKEIEKPILFNYIEIIDGCGPVVDDTCVVAYSSPTSTSPVAEQLRKGIVLQIEKPIVSESNNEIWYKVDFSNEWIRYPERVKTDWYIPASETNIRHFIHEGTEELSELGDIATSTKHILIDRSDQTLKAFDGDELILEFPISSGLAVTPTPRGSFTIYRKTPSRYMQGPLPGISNQYYDLVGVPWNLYFTEQGAVVHGAYWHDQFGKQWSHGCVNLDPDVSRELYKWADIGIGVLVRD